MSGIATAIIGGAVIGGTMSSKAQKGAASTAAGAQTDASNASIAQQNKQFEEMQKLLAPYVKAGEGSLFAQQDLLGLGGRQQQQDAIRAIEGGPQFQSMVQQGENAMLQNASATGGLRGGNLQGALAQFRPQLLNQLINEQYSKLGGITSMGQNSAAMQGNAGMQSANAISGQLGQIGNANAQNAIRTGNIQAQNYSNMAGAGGFAASSFLSPSSGYAVNNSAGAGSVGSGQLPGLNPSQFGVF